MNILRFLWAIFYLILPFKPPLDEYNHSLQDNGAKDFCLKNK